jgi:uncharacterized protein
MNIKVSDKSQIINIIINNETALKQFGVENIGIFGSFVRNEQNDDSDIDLLVEFDTGKKTFRNFMGLAFYLEDIFGRKVEIITPQSLNVYIKPHIMKEVEYVNVIR